MVSPHNSYSWDAGSHSRHTRIPLRPPPVQRTQGFSQTKVVSERGCQGGCGGVFFDVTTIESVYPRRTWLGACIIFRVSAEAAKESCRRRLPAHGGTCKSMERDEQHVSMGFPNPVAESSNTVVLDDRHLRSAFVRVHVLAGMHSKSICVVFVALAKSLNFKIYEYLLRFNHHRSI